MVDAFQGASSSRSCMPPVLTETIHSSVPSYQVHTYSTIHGFRQGCTVPNRPPKAAGAKAHRDTARMAYIAWSFFPASSCRTACCRWAIVDWGDSIINATHLSASEIPGHPEREVLRYCGQDTSARGRAFALAQAGMLRAHVGEPAWHISGGCGVVVAWIVGIAVAGPDRSQPPAHGDGIIQLVKFT